MTQLQQAIARILAAEKPPYNRQRVRDMYPVIRSQEEDDAYRKQFGYDHIMLTAEGLDAQRWMDNHDRRS